MDSHQFRARVSSVFAVQLSRARFKLAKTVPRGVTVRLPSDSILPYTRRDLHEWLWDRVGAGTVLCPYCQQLIDINSLVLDHKIPLILGGSWDLGNQEPTCARCNQLKGELLPDEFHAVRTFLDAQSAHLRTHIEACLINGPRMRRVFAGRR